MTMPADAPRSAEPAEETREVIAERLAVYAVDLDGSISVAPRDWQLLLTIADWILRDRVSRALASSPPRESTGKEAEDGKRLDWLEKRANGYPIEVDSFTGLKVKEGEEPGAHDAVFLTIHPAKEDGSRECDRFGCHMNNVVQIDSVRLGQGRTLRQAIDAAMGVNKDA